MTGEFVPPEAFAEVESHKNAYGGTYDVLMVGGEFVQMDESKMKEKASRINTAHAQSVADAVREFAEKAEAESEENRHIIDTCCLEWRKDRDAWKWKYEDCERRLKDYCDHVERVAALPNQWKERARRMEGALKDAQSVLWMAEKWADGGGATKRENVSEVVGKVGKALAAAREMEGKK